MNAKRVGTWPGADSPGTAQDRESIRHMTEQASNSDQQLRLLIERIERLEEEKKGIADDIRDVYSEAKAHGYDAKIMRQIVRLRKMPINDRREMEAVLDMYKNALGIV